MGEKDISRRDEMESNSLENWSQPEYAREYLDHSVFYIPDRATLTRVLGSYAAVFLGSTPRPRLLDLGCGDGAVSETLHRALTGAEIVTADGSADMIAAADGKPLLADGAMGTLLVARGAPPEENLDALNLTRPELAAQAHQDYLAAGAQIVETNTYGANRYKLSAAGLEDMLEKIIVLRN
jgi:hypothetical protein